MYSALETYFKDAYTPEHYPTLAIQREHWSESRPLAGLSVIDTTPLCRNTIHKYINLIDAGAKLTVAINPIGRCDAETVRLLRECGIDVVNVNDNLPQYDIIMDCAALLISHTPRIGYIELTRSHTELYAQVDRPAFIADSGRVKRIETFLGTGESYFRAMASFGYNDWQGRSLVVFGSGKVGQGIIHYANKLGAVVTSITDTSDDAQRPKPHTAPMVDFRDSDAVKQALKGAFAVVTATGVEGAIEKAVEPSVLIESKAVLANMGATDEFGNSFPAERVLNGKETINFILNDPTHLKYIDATMALHNYGAEYLVKNRERKGVTEPPVALEQQLLEWTRHYGTIGEELELINI